MVIKYSKPSNVIAKIIAYTVTASFALVCVLPMWHVLMSSFSDPILLNMNKGFLFWTEGFSTEGYKIMFQHKYLWRNYFNTVLYTVCSTSLGLVLSLLAAYVLSRKNVLFKRFIAVFIIITMLFNGGIIPLYVVVSSLKLTDNPLGMIIPMCCNAMSIIMLKNGMETISDSISEAARIDGAGHIRILLQVVMPLTTSFLAVTVLFNVIFHWNSWVQASMFISNERQDLYPLQLLMRDILIKNSTVGMVAPSGLPITLYVDLLQSVMVIIGALPLIIAYPFVQKHFEKGIIIGGVKG